MSQIKDYSTLSIPYRRQNVPEMNLIVTDLLEIFSHHFLTLAHLSANLRLVPHQLQLWEV